MTSLLTVFGFLAAVLYEGHSLSCGTCLGHGSPLCQGSIETCDKVDDTCMQGYENNTLDADTRLTAVKACHNPQETPPFVCKASDHYFRSTNFTVRFVAECGQEMGEFKVPPMNLTSNGKKCPDCFKEDTIEECKTDKLIECVGLQTDCLHFRGKAQRPGSDMTSYYLQGCATPNLCSIIHLLPGTHVDLASSQYDCTAAS
ncbi:phospholipase A2 inhibitor gamma subunit B-like [Lissotriton helveticus]